MAELGKREQVNGLPRARAAAQLKRKYEEGKSIRVLAEEAELPYRVVRELLAESGTRIRHSPVTRQTKDDRRTDAHQLLDRVPGSRLDEAAAFLRELAEPEQVDQPRRRFRTVGVFDGEPDLGRRAKEITRRELGGRSNRTA
ncbi:helix-turn-helix domain-containing protein [Amycolatopsis sp. 195334CR]|uniref:helix-turn-helix domain-containing protein n=1 Tax=Amycolatopsis sp. 195334CR TaxID=2814588 RepID=UPI001A8F909E|nr:helix-turn-helix domain-containing protein [Amycolatopsis sp. 195334CR]MBN6035050.1 hypothetical protein [Amycolatopsis sp. 195334CR]